MYLPRRMVIGSAVENVVGGKMNELCIGLTACQSQVTHTQRVGDVGGLRFFLRHVHLVVSGSVENHLWIEIWRTRSTFWLSAISMAVRSQPVSS